MKPQTTQIRGFSDAERRAATPLGLEPIKPRGKP